MPRTSPSDPALERIAGVLAAAVAALIVREVWQALRDRRHGRKRDRMILTALAREAFIIKAIAAAIVQDINRERALLREGAHWRLKPLLTLPTTLYELVRNQIPEPLLEQREGVVQLIGLQSQCAFMNRLAEEQQRWKSPTARGQEDQLDVIGQFHAPLEEAIRAVIDRCERFLPVLEAAAGKTVGGLELKKTEPVTDPQAT